MPIHVRDAAPAANVDAHLARLTRAVQAYTDAGWHLLLVGPGHKRPAWRFNSVYDATQDAGLLTGYLHETPAAGIAVALGPSQLVSIEDDGPLAHQTLADLDLPPTWTIQARRGQHRVYRDPAGVPSRRLGPELELHAAGRYIVLPPTTLGGTTRQWIRATTRAPLTELPDRLTHPAPPPAPADTLDSTEQLAELALEQTARRLALRPNQPRTGRGTALYAASCELGRHVHARTLRLDVARQALEQAAARLGLHPYEAQRSIERGLEHGPSRRAA